MQNNHALEETERRAGRALWAAASRAFAALGPQEAPATDAMTLAAYLDGRLDETARDAVEGQAAASPDTLELLLAADAALGAEAAPGERLLSRAAALVPGEALPRRRLFGRLLGGGGAARAQSIALRPFGLAAALCLLVMISVVGFELGRFGYAAAAEAYFPETEGFGLSAEAGL